MQDISIQKEQPAGQNDDSVNTAELSFHAALCNQIAQLHPFQWRQKGNDAASQRVHLCCCRRSRRL